MSDLDPSLDYDTVELAFILKAIGFQIKSVEITKNSLIKEKKIEIDLNCHASGLKTKLVLAAEKCTCPPRPLENNNSFWEIQSEAQLIPSESKDASCTVLPEISKKTSDLARSMLQTLLEEYRKELKVQGNNDGKKLSEEGQNGQNLSSLLDQIKIETEADSTPTNSDAKLKTEILNIPKINISYTKDQEGQSVTQSQISDGIFSPNFSAGTMASVVFPSPQFSRGDNGDNDRDIFIIESIQNARKELDAALLHLKCNITRDISGTSSINNTPENSKMKSRLLGAQLQQEPIKSIKRRATIGSISDDTEKDKKLSESFQRPLARKPLSGSASSLNKSKIPNSSKLTKITAKSVQSQVDTPRPRVDLKRSVEMGIQKSSLLRSATTTNLKSSSNALAKTTITKQKSALNLKK